VAKFRFRLEKVLTLRIDELEIRENELREAQTKVNEIDGFIKSTIQQANGQLVVEGSIVMAEEYLLKGTRLEWLRRQLEMARESLLTAQKELSLARDRYVEAKKEVKMLEKLKEKKLQTFTEEQDKKEQGSIDEMSTMRNGRS
jgi:flagellar FliJ protein